MTAPAHAAETSTFTDATSHTSVTGDKPTGTASGDLLVAVVTTRSSSGITHTTPSGWTLEGMRLGTIGTSRIRTSVFSLAAGASEPSTYTFEFSAASTTATILGIARLTHGSGTPLVDAVASEEGNSSSINCPSATTTANDCRVMRIGSQALKGSRTAPSGTTERWNQEPTGSTNATWQGNADAVQATVGASGSAAWSSGASTIWVGFTVAVSPPAAGDTFTATGALTSSAQTLSGSATFGPGTKTATGALTASAQTLAGSAEHTAPSFTADGALTVSAQTLSGAATFSVDTFSASGELTTSSQTLAGTATFDPGTSTATGSLIASSQTLSASATHTAPVFSADGSLTSSAQTIAGSAAFASEIFSATGALEASSQTLSGSATFAAGTYTATGALEASSQVLSGTATFVGVAPSIPDTAWQYWGPILLMQDDTLSVQDAVGTVTRHDMRMVRLHNVSARMVTLNQTGAAMR